MRAVLLVAAALAWISSCVGCGTTPNPQTPHRELAARLEDETVALLAFVDENGDRSDEQTGHAAMYCAGVWVSPDTILSAAHCAKYATGGAPAPLVELFEALGLPAPDPNPIGALVAFAGHGDIDRAHTGYWLGHIVAVDKRLDLMAIRATSVPHHPFAHLSQGVEDGDRVEIVGHPVGHLWSYFEGLVSSVRPEEPNSEGNPMPTLQVQGPVNHGNSGGGCFDANGELVGIGSYIEENAQGMGFFVYAPAIQTFLSKT